MVSRPPIPLNDALRDRRYQISGLKFLADLLVFLLDQLVVFEFFLRKLAEDVFALGFVLAVIKPDLISGFFEHEWWGWLRVPPDDSDDADTPEESISEKS